MVELLNWAQSQGPLVAILALLVVGFVRGDLVPKYIYEAMKKERDAYKETLDRVTGVAEGLVKR